MGGIIEDDCSNNGKYGHTDQHSRDTEYASADHDCHQYDKKADPRKISDYSRSDKIVVDLLQYENENNKVNCLYRIHHEDQDSAGNSSQISAEKRNNICHSHDNADQYGIRHSQQCCAYVAPDGNVQRIQQHAYDISAKG